MAAPPTDPAGPPAKTGPATGSSGKAGPSGKTGPSDTAGLRAAYEECRSIARREAKNFYYAFLTLPPRRRAAMLVVYAFCRHCDDAVDTAGSTEQKLAALAQIRRSLHSTGGETCDKTCDATCDTTAAAAAPAPVFLALADVARRFDIPGEYFQDLVSGVETDLVKTRYANFQELRQYCYQVASVVGLICLHIFGCRDPRARQPAIDLGLAMQLTNIARDVKEDLDMGRVYLPQDEMARFGYSQDDLDAGTFNRQFVELMQFQGQRAREYFRSGFTLLPHLPPRSRACPAVMGKLYSKILDRMESRGYDVLHHRVSLSTAEKLRILALAWAGGWLSGIAPNPKPPQPEPDQAEPPPPQLP